MSKQKNLYIDTETTGLREWKNELYQIGALLEIDGEVVDEFSGFCKPVAMDNIEPKALEVSGRTIEQLESYGPYNVMFRNFMAFIKKHHDPNKERPITLVGQNIINFDIKFLKKFFTLNGYGDRTGVFTRLFGYQFVDMYPFNFFLRNKGFIPKNGKLSLDYLRPYYGIPIDHAHDALDDAKSTYKMMKLIENLFFKKPDEVDLSKFEEETPIYRHIQKLLNPETVNTK